MLTAHITLKPLASRTGLTECMGAKLLFLITPFYRIQLCLAGDSFVLMLQCWAMCGSQCGCSDATMSGHVQFSVWLFRCRGVRPSAVLSVNAVQC